MESVSWIGRGITFPLRDSSIEPEELSHSDTDRSEGERCTKPGQKGAFWGVSVGERVGGRIRMGSKSTARAMRESSGR